MGGGVFVGAEVAVGVTGGAAVPVLKGLSSHCPALCHQGAEAERAEAGSSLRSATWLRSRGGAADTEYGMGVA